jgi:hypothetical protein
MIKAITNELDRLIKLSAKNSEDLGVVKEMECRARETVRSGFGARCEEIKCVLHRLRDRSDSGIWARI